jgi:hypothetical protein
MIGIAVGNGTSRLGIDLEPLRGEGRYVVGCNWIFWDYSPDAIVAIDKEPCKALREMPRDYDWITSTNPRSHIQIIKPDGTSHVIMSVLEINGTLSKNSGIIACSYLSKHLKCERVYMLGYDFFRILPGMKQNDMYHAGLIGFRNYERAINKLVADCPHTEFVRVGDIPESETEYFHETLKGMTYISYDDFWKELK